MGQLWLELLKFYSLKFDSMETVVSIKFDGQMSRSDKKWKGKRLAIEGTMLLLTHTIVLFMSIVPIFCLDACNVICKKLDYIDFDKNVDVGLLHNLIHKTDISAISRLCIAL